MSEQQGSGEGPAPERHDGVPELTDGVVLLRGIDTHDVDVVVRACQDPQTQRWTTIPVPYLREHAVEFVGRNRWADRVPDAKPWREMPLWVITDATDGRYGGAVDLRPDGQGSAEVGYALAPWLRGRGLMTRALRLACRWGFDELGLARVEWRAFVGNEASRRTAERVGFRVLDGYLRQDCLARGARYDSWVGDLLPGDLLAGDVRSAPLPADPGEPE